MSDLVVRVVVNVLWEVRVKDLKFGGISGIPTPARDFTVLDAPEFVVLHPKIALQDFGRSREPEQGRVSFGQSTATSLSATALSKNRRSLGEKSNPGTGSSGVSA